MRVTVSDANPGDGQTTLIIVNGKEVYRETGDLLFLPEGVSHRLLSLVEKVLNDRRGGK